MSAERHDHHGGHHGANHAAHQSDDRLVERSADAAVAAMAGPRHVLDVGCGSGGLLRELVVRLPHGASFLGVDVSRDALAEAGPRSDGRIDLVRARAENLPLADASFDLVVTSVSFHHWSDQARGLAELARVVRRNGRVVLVDMCAGPLRRTPEGTRSARQIATMLDAAGLRVRSSETLRRTYRTLPLVRAFVASR